jgi:hypothetical protein
MALDGLPLAKYGYYALCLACGVLAAARPSVTDLVATIESSINLGLVILTIPITYLRVLQTMLDGHAVANPFTAEFFANFALSAGVALTAHLQNQRALLVTRR